MRKMIISKITSIFFDPKPPSFKEFGIREFVEKWRHVIDNNGAYVVD
jgi:hypothetical protein